MESLKKIVLTFDDGMKSNFDFTCQVLKKHKQTATFFISRNHNLWKGTELEEPLISDEELQTMNNDGFELANHTFSHMDMFDKSHSQIQSELGRMESYYQSLGIPKPTTISYPSFQHNELTMKILKSLGYKFARAGYKPNVQCENNAEVQLNAAPWNRKEVSYYFPGVTNPMQIFCTGILNGNDRNPCYTSELFIKDIEQTPEGAIPVFGGHGMPTKIRKDNFERITQYLHDNNWKTICMRDL